MKTENKLIPTAESLDITHLGKKVPLYTSTQEVEEILFKISGFDPRFYNDALRFRTLIHDFLELAFARENTADHSMTFDSKTLAKLTEILDVVSDNPGYDYWQRLERDAALLIPGPVYHPFDVTELLLAFVRLRRNFAVIRPIMTVALFILFFNVYSAKFGHTSFRHDLVVNELLYGSAGVFIENVKKILSGGAE